MTVLLPRDRRRSRHLFDWSARWTLERNALDAITSQVATFTRASVANGVGSNGVLVPYAHSAPRYTWVDLDADSVLETPALLLEDTRTNVVLHKRDLTNAAWTKTNTTAARDQTGIDGVPNNASSLAATAGNGTCLQAITLASSARYQSAYVKRITGSGNIQMTTDNGSTWTTVTGLSTTAWTRITIPTQMLANPTVGFRIVTNGDKIAIDWVQNENGTFITSPIGTIADNAATETRAADSLSFPFLALPQAMTWYAKFIESGTLSTGSTSGLLGIGAATNPALMLLNDGTGHYTILHRRASDVQSPAAAAPSIGQLCELRGLLNADGSVRLGQSIAGAAEVVAAASAANALATAWHDTTLTIDSRGASSTGYMALVAVRIAAGAQSLAFMQAG